MLLALGLIWGAAFFFAKVAVVEVHPLHLVFYRVCIAALSLYGLLLILGKRLKISLRLAGLFIILGALNNVIPFGLLYWGQVHIGTGLASILNATTPFFAMIIAHTLTQDEKITPAKTIGLGAGLFGVILLIGQDAFAGLGAATLAQLACIGAALSYGFASVFGKQFKSTEPIVVATGQLTASSFISVLVVLIFVPDDFLTLPSLPVIGAILALALVATSGAYILFFEILRVAGATGVSLVTFIVPVTAASLGMLFLGERFALSDLYAIALIAAGLAVIDGRLMTQFRRLREKTTAP